MTTTDNTLTLSTEDRLRQRLNDPHTAEMLLQIMDKLDVVMLTVNSMDGFLRRGDIIIDNIADSVKEVRNLAPESDVDLEKTATTLANSLPQLIDALPQLTASLPQLVDLAERLNDPKVSESLNQIIDHIDLAAFALHSADGFLQRSDVVIENVADSINDVSNLAHLENNPTFIHALQMLNELSQTLPELLETMPRFISMLPTLTNVTLQLQNLLESPEFDALMKSGVFSPKTVDIVGQAGDALVESYEENQVRPQSIGLLGLLSAVRDPDVQRALGFAVSFGKCFGKAINK